MAILLNGTTQYLRRIVPKLSNTVGFPFSISLLFKAAANPADDYVIALRDEDSSNIVAVFLDQAGRWVRLYAFDGGSTITSNTTGYTADAWQMATITVAADGTCKIYLNGGNVVTAGTNRSPTGMDVLFIGAEHTTNNKYPGEIAEIGIWSKELTGVEVSALYNSGTFKRPSTNSTNLLRYYTLDSVLTDSQGSGDTLEAVGAPSYSTHPTQYEPAPEINITGNGQSITSGDNTPSADDHTNFGSINVESGSQTRTFTIQNTGDANLTLSGTPKVALSGANAADFTVSVQPSSPVAASGSTTFSIVFDPSAAGTRSATVSIANNDGNENPYTFSIQGTGLAPEINITGNGQSITNGDNTPSANDHTDFGSIDYNSGAQTRTFTIQNTGDANLTLSGTPKVALSGAHASDFTVSAQPSSPVAASGSTTFSIAFDPSAAGERTATVSITNNDNNENPYTFSIKGTGVASTASITGSTSLGSVYIDEYLDVIYTITNTGNSNLTLTGTPIVALSGDAAFSVISDPSTPVTAGNSTTFTIRFTPTTIGEATTTVSIVTNDPNNNPYVFNITGVGQLSGVLTAEKTSETIQIFRYAEIRGEYVVTTNALERNKNNVKLADYLASNSCVEIINLNGTGGASTAGIKGSQIIMRFPGNAPNELSLDCNNNPINIT